MSSRRTALGLTLCALGAVLAGCNNKVLDPAQIGRFRPTPAVNVILNSLGVAEENPVAWESGQEPRPGDIVAIKEDYALRPGDLVRISVFELFQEGVPVVNDYIVSETGKISIPDVGVLAAAGLTERQLEDEIKRVLSPNVLRNPSVTVTLLDSQQRTFSILGNAVARPSRYLIPRYDFRLADALATAGAQMQFNVSYVYVSRRGDGTAPADAAPAQPLPELDLLEPGSQSRAGRTAAPRPTTTTSSPPLTGGRPPQVRRDIPEPKEPAQRFETEREMFELIAPRAQHTWPQSEKVAGLLPGTVGDNSVTASVLPDGLRVLTPSMGDPWRIASAEIVPSPVEFGTATPAEPAAEPRAQERVEWVFRDGKWVQVVVTDGQSRSPTPPGFRSTSAQAGPGEGLEWVFRDGRWVQTTKSTLAEQKPRVPAVPETTGEKQEMLVPPRPPRAASRVPADTVPLDDAWEQAIQTRLIRVPADKLLAGDPRYNIVIKPGDTIHVPVDIIGEFAIMGNVNRSGYIDITGRPMTLKMAIAAAGGLGPLAWPKNVEVTRRIGTAREEIVMVDLDKVASGEQPDFFIKPNDLINVGTHPTSRWRAVLRNAFRATYGFGFVYDRNFADIDYGTGFPWFRNL
ncbi:MAG: polysaccharide biosynthesis/export family protein [Planctomycetes bacterium]|nr:polysaccharide biosynthesis/export family protein [Planctomycetota bacterium]